MRREGEGESGVRVSPCACVCVSHMVRLPQQYNTQHSESTRLVPHVGTQEVSLLVH
jgi:hypothetical protein